MEKFPSPEYEDMVRVFRKVYECCMKNGIPIGLAPNIEVSLVVQPTDAEFLLPDNIQKLLYKTKISMMKTLAGMIFKKELQPHKVKGNSQQPPIVSKQ